MNLWLLIRSGAQSACTLKRLSLVLLALSCLTACGQEAIDTDTELLRFAKDYAAAWSSGDPARLASFYTAEGSLVVNEGEPAVGRGAVEATARDFMTAFPDMAVELVRLEREGDRVVFYWHWTGTNTGPGGNGGAVDLTGYERWTLEDGLIAESRGHYDEAEYRRQLEASGNRAVDGPELEARITRIEEGLAPVLRIKGEPERRYSIDDRLEELGIPGLSVAVAVDGRVEWARAWGMADVDDNEPMTTDTLLLAGSISKPVAAVRALQLVEEGVFELDENINRYLASWQLPDNEFTATEKVTLRRILSHTAGLTVWGFPGYDQGDDIPGVVDVLEGKGNTEPVRVYRRPGEGWQYSGGGYTILQLAITDTEQSSFPATMATHVLEPLGMADSTYENPLPERFHGRAATGYRADGTEVEGEWPIYPEMAAAGLWTTPSELVQYAIAVQTILLDGSDGILRHGTVLEMLDADSGTHGLGPSVDEYTFGHGGADEGFRATLAAWTDRPVAVVAMVNSDNGRILREVMLSIAAEYELPGFEPVIREIADVGPDELDKFIGQYEGDPIGTVNVRVEDGRLQLTGEDGDFRTSFHPQGPREFFDAESGAILEFSVENGVAEGFVYRSITMKRIGD